MTHDVSLSSNQRVSTYYLLETLEQLPIKMASVSPIKDTAIMSTLFIDTIRQM
jgi:hypothetical protein